MDEAVEALARATREGQVAAAVLHVVQRETSFTRSFGKAQSDDLDIIGQFVTGQPQRWALLAELSKEGDS